MEGSEKKNGGIAVFDMAAGDSDDDDWGARPRFADLKAAGFLLTWGL